MTTPNAKAKTPARKTAGDGSGTNDVDDFMRKLDHPLKAEMEAVRRIILGASPMIQEGIKWNFPSFRVGEYFATMNVRKGALLVILHLGAKVRDARAPAPEIGDPSGLLEWLAKDRAAVRFPDMKSIRSNRAAFEAIVRKWITCL